MTKADLFKEPEGFHWGTFQNAKGAEIRYGHVAPEGEIRGTMVILGGFNESIEKYFEVTREMNARGFDVWLMDWRGQGGSERYLPNTPQRAHHEGYDEQISTLHTFTQTIVKRTGDKPLMMAAHSMGGHIGLRFLKEHPGIFDSAMVTAPMLDIMTGVVPRPLARQMAKFAKAGSYLDKYVPGGSDWSEGKVPFEGNDKTGDRDRFDIGQAISKTNDAAKLGDPTYGWLYHTFQSIDVLNKEDYLKSITTPVLMQISDNEKIVDRGAQERAANLLPNCRRVDIPGARHEIWQETDNLRGLWLKQMDAFIAERLNPAAPAAKKPSCVKKPPRPSGPAA